MSTDPSVEHVAPTEIREGDVIEDPVGNRWVTVHAIQLSSDSASGSYSFYGTGPDDRVTFNGSESVTRQK
ncbi:hypothetical protein [Mycolicibacterium confluentis]|uniref:Uncharacterized protein n=1 Tax=Mycolicibacterium confluentis TaxID=28047 RepID=A0A7I7Y2Y1_9MYCO|nr:hypothetical protein [Mycolicibacterium confluentis]MCV7318136.1 hypothetical protein [Mycolicibacterium confluentis]ORV31224.1 hypothetical protein AWB99_12495 [Mycolicibacterium confluentis]BBZ36045.1 hypothetical protein MCNF_46500 [Mycolicibacterium confluentis]